MFVFFTVVIIFKVLTPQVESEIVPFVRHGENANIENWPFIVSVQDKISGRLEHICSGSILAPKLVLTAAHCIKTCVANRCFTFLPYQVVAGDPVYNYSDPKRSSNRQVRRVIRQIVHPKFQYKAFPENQTINYFEYYKNDLTLLEVEKPFDFNSTFVRRTVLAKYTFPSSTDCKFAGWGETEKSMNYSDILKFGSTKIVNNAICSEGYAQFDKESMYCVYYSNENTTATACLGDGGAPLICGRKLHGIASFGGGDPICDLAYTVYAKIPGKNYHWINQYIRRGNLLETINDFEWCLGILPTVIITLFLISVLIFFLYRKHFLK